MKEINEIYGDRLTILASAKPSIGKGDKYWHCHDAMLILTATGIEFFFS